MTRLSRPLDSDAVKAADERIYEEHKNEPRPNSLYDKDGNRIPLKAGDPLCDVWIQYYIEAGGGVDDEKPSNDKPGDIPKDCPYEDLANLFVKVVSKKFSAPIEDAAVCISGPEDRIGHSGKDGWAAFEGITPGSYSIDGDHAEWARDPGTASAHCPPATSTNAEVILSSDCEYWKLDHSKEIDVKDTKYNTSTQYTTAATVKYRFEANLAAGDVSVVLVFKMKKVDAGVTDDMVKKTKAKFKSKIASLWNGKYSVKVTDPKCGTKTLPIKFKVLWTPDDTTDSQHYTVNLETGGVHANVAYPTIEIDYAADVDADDAWTLAHEFGHTFGLHDEYFYTGVTAATVKYKRADGTEESVTLEPSPATIMSKNGNTSFKKRAFFFAEIEAQELLRAKSGRDVVCEVV